MCVCVSALQERQVFLRTQRERSAGVQPRPRREVERLGRGAQDARGGERGIERGAAGKRRARLGWVAGVPHSNPRPPAAQHAVMY